MHDLSVCHVNRLPCHIKSLVWGIENNRIGYIFIVASSFERNFIFVYLNNLIFPDAQFLRILWNQTLEHRRLQQVSYHNHIYTDSIISQNVDNAPWIQLSEQLVSLYSDHLHSIQVFLFSEGSAFLQAQKLIGSPAATTLLVAGVLGLLIMIPIIALFIGFLIFPLIQIYLFPLITKFNFIHEYEIGTTEEETGISFWIVYLDILSNETLSIEKQIATFVFIFLLAIPLYFILNFLSTVLTSIFMCFFNKHFVFRKMYLVILVYNAFILLVNSIALFCVITLNLDHYFVITQLLSFSVESV